MLGKLFIRPLIRRHQHAHIVGYVCTTDRECSPKSELFYEEEGKHRRYYYVMDLRGQLFIESAVRNIATSMKDKKFLDFMYKNLKPNDSGFAQHIPYVTLCGKEMNFVTPIDPYSAFVFKDITPPSHEDDAYKLHFGGTLSQDFNPKLLSFCNDNGRFYHKLTHHRTLSKSGHFGLLNVDITTRYICDNLVFDSPLPETYENSQAGKLCLRWKGSHEEETLFDIEII